MISNEIYKFFADYVFENLGILYKETDYYRLDARINALIKHFSVPGPAELHQLLKMEIDKTTHEFIVDLFTNNETYFLRDIKPFKAFAKGIFPTLKIGKVPGTKVSLWSCACSTGQEVYSIKMAIDSFAEPGDLNYLHIDASDISQEALAKARSGKYLPLEVQRGLPAPFLVKYFENDSQQQVWNVKESLKRDINFQQFNLLNGHFPSNKYEMIFCRNVLIYQNQENKRKILESIFHALKPGGYLLLGAGESMIGMNLPFKHVEVEGSWFYKRED